MHIKHRAHRQKQQRGDVSLEILVSVSHALQGFCLHIVATTLKR